MSSRRMLPLAALLMASACDPTTLEPKQAEAALSLSTGGYVDTDFPVSDLQAGPRTLSVRFMLKYPNSYYNALFGESGTTGNPNLLFIGKDNSGSNGADSPRLVVNLGGTWGTFTLPGGKDFQAAQWYHLALTVDANREVRLFLDGVEATAGQASLQVPAATWASGNLRIGQRNSTMVNPEQFYGLVDDVAIWDTALTAAEISSLAQNPKLTGNEPHLLAGWNFDVLVGGAQPLPKHNRPITYAPAGGATLAVPNAAKSFTDLLVTANHKTQLGLPVKGSWKVIQGSDSPPNSSHRGYASFCMDIVRTDEPDTRGQEVYAAADGKVVFIRDTSPDSVPHQQVPGCNECEAGDDSCGYRSNQVTLEHAGDELTEYLHIQPNSVPQAIKDKLVSGALVKKGELLGKVGKSGTGGDHLHFSLLWKNVLNGDNGASPGTDTPKAGDCGYTPAVRSPSVLTRPFVLYNYKLQPGGAGAFEEGSNLTPQAGDVLMP